MNEICSAFVVIRHCILLRLAHFRFLAAVIHCLVVEIVKETILMEIPIPSDQIGGFCNHFPNGWNTD